MGKIILKKVKALTLTFALDDQRYIQGEGINRFLKAAEVQNENLQYRVLKVREIIGILNTGDLCQNSPNIKLFIHSSFWPDHTLLAMYLLELQTWLL